MSKTALMKPEMGFGISISTLDELERAAVLASQSGFFKNAIDVAKGCMVMQYGAELGISPIASLQNVNVIEGKLSLSGSMIAALIKGSNRYDYKPIEVSPTLTRILFLQDGVEQGIVQYSWADAERAGLTRKFNWKSYPEDMIWWRCLARGARRFCPDVFLGKVYTPEELSDGDYLPDGEQWSASLPTSVVEMKEVKPTDKGNGEKKESIVSILESSASNKEISKVKTSEPKEKNNGEQETKKEPEGKSSSSLMLGFMSAVDSCLSTEELDDTMDSWAESLSELPRGTDHCDAYWRVAVASMNEEAPKENDVEMANKLSRVRK